MEFGFYVTHTTFRNAAPRLECVACDAGDAWLQIRIAVSSVTDVVKMNTVMIIPNAVGIFTASHKVRRRATHVPARPAMNI